MRGVQLLLSGKTMNNIEEYHITVQRTARYYQLGEVSEQIREVWFVCHGYGQLASYFIRNFTGLNHPTRLIIAPEALSRFYLKDFTGRVGATWMTREDRELEIVDQRLYLSHLYHTILEQLQTHGVGHEELRVVVLGFSQGATTVCRWVFAEKDNPNIAVHRLILWAGGMPVETNWDEYGKYFLSLDPVFVYGENDEFITGEKVQEQQRIWESSGIECPIVVFQGGHVIMPEVLSTLATTQNLRVS